MKIGIMSMQRIINYGSFLQAYGLKRTLENMGHQVQFVDYEIGAPLIATKRDGHWKCLMRKGMGAVKLVSPSYRAHRQLQIQANKSFGDFYSRFQSEYLPQLGISEQRNLCPQLDALVIGSDEVFNCTQANGDVGYSLQLFGKDRRARRLISYAASFGSTTLEKLDQHGVRQEIADCLSTFDCLSVRDENSAQIVSSLLGRSPVQNIDPVLLYDFPEAEDIEVTMKDYMVVYAYAGRIRPEEEKVIREFAKKHGKTIVSLGFWQTFCDVCVPATPLEVLAYIKHADYVITDTFHGTVFSIKNQVPFATLIRNSNQEKLSDLLRRFHLEKRSVTRLSDLEAVVTQPLDKSAVCELLGRYQAQAKEYLKTALTADGQGSVIQ